MTLSMYDWVYGVAQLAAGFLAIVAGIISVHLFRLTSESRNARTLVAWKYLLVALILFVVEEIIGGLKTFGLYSNVFLTHVIPSFILAFLIAALIAQIAVAKGWVR